ncbi:DUF2169 family type VI secretion system accessory protein [Myxococcus virescens]|uniref:DUF2169 domain-containing protein n=1 Tax=Myxococcus virescens TaxID=83456 RepID=A0A511H9R5_9BACT|nr:DUF2169 domain-containing protein [Myxococcus virescens]GEL70272.1 hypothetical protein MVI01_20560 [Myxococcus virescens]SDE95846.1 hypothetical protein SAMN04488504_115169 [Myxococcus virescens]
MFETRNETPFASAMFLFPDEQGIETVYAVLKATFEIHSHALSVAELQRPVTLMDEYWTEPGTSSLRYPGEAHVSKPGTDVLLVGDAHAPRGRPTGACLVRMKVGPIHKDIHVFGNRTWRGGLLSPGPTPPEPFTLMPLTWERAFGGTHDLGNGRILAEPRNPVGQSFRGKRSGREMLGRALPNIEDPRAPIGSISDAPAPVGIAPIAPAWEPRRSRAGTYDEVWQTQRAPHLPQDFNPEFLCTAPSGQWVQPGLKGGEPVELHNLSPRGPQRFALPTCKVEVEVRIDGHPRRPRMHLETVLLSPGEQKLCLTWRGAVNCDKQALRVERIRFSLQSMTNVQG